MPCKCKDALGNLWTMLAEILELLNPISSNCVSWASMPHVSRLVNYVHKTPAQMCSVCIIYTGYRTALISVEICWNVAFSVLCTPT